MFTTGSKLLIGSAAAAWISAAVYGIAQGGALGSIGLISAAVALSLLAAVNVYVRDSNVSALDHEHFEAAAAAQATAGPSLWPLLVAVGATTMTLGLVTFEAIFVLGLIAVVAGALEWLVQGWSERASADQEFNSEVREVMADPFELPVAGAIAAGIVVYAFSRVMLGLPSKSATVVAFVIMAAVVLLVGGLLGLRPVSKPMATGAFSVAVVALVAAGAIFGLNGERDIEEHHTTGYIAEENECGTQETEADEKASQTVASKSAVAAELTFADEHLTAELPGFDGEYEEITLPRSNPSNVLFHNDTDEEARLVIELHPDVDSDGVPTGPERLCTALVEPGGTQLLTVLLPRPSLALDEGYAFTVAGSDAEVGVVVP
jgi:hypothetical protein